MEHTILTPQVLPTCPSLTPGTDTRAWARPQLKTQHSNMRQRKPGLRLIAHFPASEVRSCVAKLGERQMLLSDEKKLSDFKIICFISFKIRYQSWI